MYHSLTQHNFQGDAIGLEQIRPLFTGEPIALGTSLNDVLRTVPIVAVTIADVTRVGKVLGQAILFFKNTFPYTFFAGTMQDLGCGIIASLKELNLAKGKIFTSYEYPLP